LHLPFTRYLPGRAWAARPGLDPFLYLCQPPPGDRGTDDGFVEVGHELLLAQGQPLQLADRVAGHAHELLGQAGHRAGRHGLALGPGQEAGRRLAQAAPPGHHDGHRLRVAEAAEGRVGAGPEQVRGLLVAGRRVP
jgi:hypothetical protein